MVEIFFFSAAVVFQGRLIRVLFFQLDGVFFFRLIVFFIFQPAVRDFLFQSDRVLCIVQLGVGDFSFSASVGGMGG